MWVIDSLKILVIEDERYLLEEIMEGECFEKIVSELVDNAFKFSAPGDLVHVSCRREADHFVVSVQDQGHGIAAERLPTLGTLGQPARDANEQRGIGLGLIIVRRLAELHGGKLVVKSRLRTGTTMQVYVPLAGESADRASAS